MAKQWGSSSIGQFSHPKPVFTKNRRRETRTSSGLKLQNYHGPYDIAMLSRARDELCCHIEHMQDTAVWYKIKQKTEVSVLGGFYFNDGFGEASTAFSHAELHENEDIVLNQEDISSDSQNRVSENSTLKPAQTATSVAESELVVDLTEDGSKDISNNSDCFVVEDEDSISSVNKDIGLVYDGHEIIADKGDSDVVIIDVNINNKEEIEKPSNETKTWDNKVIENGEYSKSDNSIGQAQGRNNFTLKCDFCDFVSETKSVVQQHLNEAVHFAASKYAIDNEGNMSLTMQKVLLNEEAKFKTILVICPYCMKVFPDIHGCATHSNLWHQKESKGEKYRYGLLHVIQEEVCDNSIRAFKCQYCSKCFNSRKGLTLHMKVSNHYPFSDLNNYNKIFFCLHCKTSYDSFEKVIKHQDSGHWKFAKEGVVQFAVFHYKSVECHTVLHGTNLALETMKRKHDGKASDMEPKKKVAHTNASESLTTTSSESSSNTTGNNSNLDTGSFMESSENSTDSSSKPNSKENDFEQESVLSEKFRCDYCTKMIQDGNHMYLHLVENFHSSASTVLVDHQGNIAYLKNTKTISYEGAGFKKVVATCIEDSCRLLFDTPYICDDHNIRCHNGTGGYYHVADIVARTTIKESLSSNVCSVCKQSFEKAKQLNNHYSQTNHFPFQAREDCNIYVLCCYCSKTFSSYKVGSNHVRMHVSYAKNDQLDLVILFISKRARMISIPPYEPTKQGELTSIRSKLTSLRKMKKICGKSGKSQLRKEIQYMQKLL